MPGNGALPRIASADLAVVQYTSGSTMAPRGVMLTHANVLAGLSAIAVSAQMTSTDVWVQWTPPYHDLGLFGMSASVLNGGATYAISPRTFIRRPEAFLELVAGVRGTITTGPNFSYDLLIEAARSTGVLDELDLSSWRLAFNGGEQVSASTVETFADVFAIAGVSSSAMYPVYGMAEATLAVSFPAPGSVPTVRWVDRDLLGTAGRAAWIDRTDPRAVGLVCVGSAVSGLQLRVVSAGQGCGDSRLGEIQLRGPAVTSGYYRNEQASSALFDDGWLRTGDLGFRVDDELYVCGRAKEMIIVHGSNYFPTDAEHLARYVPGVYRGRVVAFSDVDSRGGEYIGLIAETDLPSSEHSTLAQEIHRRIAAMLGTGRIRVHLVAPRFLTRSTSGKWQRLAAAQRLAVNHLSFATSSELTK
jgi:acyl-CoA synthetase (AMP-forming)/AMP-acid ligase II